MIDRIINWFKVAKPNPNTNDITVQYGCHLEEIAEMLLQTNDTTLRKVAEEVADSYKNKIYQLSINHETKLLDSLCDQIVTSVGVAYMLGYDIEKALDEVIKSNNSKFVNGKAIFNEQGKIIKGEDYFEPNLSKFIK